MQYEHNTPEATIPAINRRRLLLGMAAASTAAATVTVAVASAPAENPELMRLGDNLPAVHAEYLAARSARSSIVEKWVRLWPLAPLSIVKDFRDDYSMERGLTGASLVRPGEARAHPLYSVSDVQWRLKRARSVLKGKTVDRRLVQGGDRAGWESELASAEEIERDAARYEADKARVLKASGYEAAEARQQAARTALEALVKAIMDQPDTTMEGIMVKAQALAAWGSVDEWAQIFSLNTFKWGPAIAASVLRYAQGGAA